MKQFILFSKKDVKRRVTLVVIYHFDTQELYYFHSTCSEKDTFCKKTGIEKAKENLRYHSIDINSEPDKPYLESLLKKIEEKEIQKYKEWHRRWLKWNIARMNGEVSKIQKKQSKLIEIYNNLNSNVPVLDDPLLLAISEKTREANQ
jgi:flagellar motility protein MotE (MotC chaperone)